MWEAKEGNNEGKRWKQAATFLMHTYSIFTLDRRAVASDQLEDKWGYFLGLTPPFGKLI